MRAYQDADPLHGNGKAIPHPKQPTRYTYRGTNVGHHVSVKRSRFETVRKLNLPKPSAFSRDMLSVAALIIACLPRSARKR